MSATTTSYSESHEDTKQYILTELGKQFVHYTTTELVARLPGESTPDVK